MALLLLFLPFLAFSQVLQPSPGVELFVPQNDGRVEINVTRPSGGACCTQARSENTIPPGNITVTWTSVLGGIFSSGPSQNCPSGALVSLYFRSSNASVLILSRGGTESGQITKTVNMTLAQASTLDVDMTCSASFSVLFSLNVSSDVPIRFLSQNSGIVSTIITRGARCCAQARRNALVPAGTYKAALSFRFVGDFAAGCSTIIIGLGSEVLLSSFGYSSLTEANGRLTTGASAPLFINLTCNTGWSVIINNFRLTLDVRCPLPHQWRNSDGDCVNYDWVALKSVRYSSYYWVTDNSDYVPMRNGKTGRVRLIHKGGNTYEIKNELDKPLGSYSFYPFFGTPKSYYDFQIPGQVEIVYANDDPGSNEIYIYGIWNGKPNAWFAPNLGGYTYPISVACNPNDWYRDPPPIKADAQWIIDPY